MQLLALWSVAVLALQTSACGVGVHLAVAHRTVPFLPNAVKDYEAAVRAGSFFPDAFYSCMGYSDAAEDAHWPPFLKTAVSYWHEKYNKAPKGSAEHTEHANKHHWRTWASKIVDRTQEVFGSAGPGRVEVESSKARDKEVLRAFLYGVLTHQVADVSWHSLGVQQGLLRMLANREFGGDVSEAHNVLDTGGDMIFVRQMLQSGVELDMYGDDWEYPTEDILEILYRSGYSVSPSELDYCMFRGRTAIRAELQVARTGFVPYARRSPLLFEHINDYYLGGVNEITLASRHCAYKLTDWFHSGAQDDAWGLCEIYEGMSRHVKEGVHGHDHDHGHHSEVFEAEGLEETQHIPASSESEIDEPVIPHLATVSYDAEEPFTMLTAGTTQAGFGSSLAIGNFLNGKPCLAIAAPYESVKKKKKDSVDVASKIFEPRGSVYVIDLGQLHVTKSRTTSPISRLELSSTSSKYEFNERFGATLVTLRLFDDTEILAVSRPGLSRVDFFYENRNVFNIFWNGASTKYGSSGLKLVGESLAVGDLDGDGVDELIVGSPYVDIKGHTQTGEVYVVNGLSLQQLFSLAVESTEPVDVDIKDIVQRGLQIPDSAAGSYNLFGSKVAVVSRGSRNILLVGAEGVGKVYAFDPSNNYKYAFVLSAKARGSDFGGRMLAANSDGWIAVADSRKDIVSPRTGRIRCSQCGSVYIYRLAEAVSGKGSKPETDEDWVHLVRQVDNEGGGSQFSRFGYEGQFVGNELYVSSPHAENGQGSVWKIDVEDSELEAVKVISSGPAPFSNGFGGSLAAANIDGMKVLAVGLPYHGYTDENWLQGSVAVYTDV